MRPITSPARQPTGRSWSPQRALLIGALCVGLLDGLDAIVVFGLRSGATPLQIFQTIASGLLGPDAYGGGWRTGLIGLALHFFIAAVITAAYLITSRVVPTLARRPFRYGPLYGIVVYFVMNLIVIPMSAIGAANFTVFGLVNGLAIHCLGVGLPAALVASRVNWHATAGDPV